METQDQSQSTEVMVCLYRCTNAGQSAPVPNQLSRNYQQRRGEWAEQ